MKVQILSRSTVDDVSAVSSSIATAIATFDFTSDVYFAQINQILNTNLVLITEALNERKNKSILSPADDKRDNTIRIIFYEVKSKTLWLDENIKHAAEKIYDILEIYGIEIANLPYLKQSAQSKALFADLKKPEMVKAIALIPGLAALIEQAENVHIEFDALFDKYLTNKTVEATQLSASKLQKILLNLINDELLTYLKVMARTKPEIYKAFYDKVVTAIEESNSKVKARLNRNTD